MANEAVYVQAGQIINYSNASGSKIAAGSLVAFGEGVGVAACDIPNGALGSIALSGVYEMTKNAKANTYSVGAKVYWSSGNKVVTTGGKHIGWAVEASTSSDETVKVLLIPGGVTIDTT